MSIVRMRKTMQGWFRPLMLVIAIVLAAGVALMMTGGGSSPGGRGEDSALAEINGKQLDRRIFEQRVYQSTKPIMDERDLSPLEEEEIYGQEFDRMVDQALLVDAAEREGIKVYWWHVRRKKDDLVDKQMKEIKENLLSQYKGKKTDELFEKELKKQDPSVNSISKLRAELRKSLDSDLVRQQMMIDELVKKLKSGIDTSESAVRASFDSFHYWQITIGTSGRSAVQAEKRAKDLVAKLRKGADFATLAKEHSDDMFKMSGGDRGFIRRAFLQEEIEGVLSKLKPGQVSDPVKTTDEYVILKFEERKSELPADFKDPKKHKGYRQAYISQKQYKVMGKYFEDIRKTAKIKILDPELKAYAALKDARMKLGSASPAQQKAEIKKVLGKYEAALGKVENRPDALARVNAHIAMLYNALRSPGMSPSKVEQVKYRSKAKAALIEALSNRESPDMRLMAAEIAIEEGKSDEALEHLDFVAGVPAEDPGIHYKTLSLLEKIKGSEKTASMIAEERQWLTDYEREMREQQSSLRPPTPAPASRR